MIQEILDIRVFAALEPISTFGPAKLRELLEYCHIETVEEGDDPFKDHPLQGESVYLVKGKLEVTYSDGNRVLIHADSEWARHPIGKRHPERKTAAAITRIQLLRVNDNLLDQMVTWEQFSIKEEDKVVEVKERTVPSKKRFLTSGMFSADDLSKSPFYNLPSAHIGKLLDHIESIAVWENEIIIREGDEGDYYYLIESGKALVTRKVDEGSVVLAELKAGDVFGEEALILNAKRNATVVMKTNGVLLRLQKHDFFELMQEPLLRKINFQEAKQKVSEGAIWIDVRNPPEFRHDKLLNAINVPLSEVRHAANRLDKAKNYVAYCQSGRRSAAAAFLLVQAGYKVDVLENGLWSIPESQQQ